MITGAETVLKKQKNGHLEKANEPLKTLEEIMSDPDPEKEIASLLSLITQKDTPIAVLQNELLILRHSRNDNLSAEKEERKSSTSGTSAFTGRT